MRKIWKYISYLGISGDNDQFTQRTLVLSNQLNFIMLLTSLLILISTVITLLLTRDTISYGTLRIVLLLLINLLNLLIARYGYTKLSRLILVFIPPVVFLMVPTLAGYVEEESYTYYPYVLIAASIIPQLLLLPDKEKFLFWLSQAYYLIFIISIDKIMVHFGNTSYPIVDRIKTFYPFYKISHVIVFLFINAGIYYLRRLNLRFEEELNRKNVVLDLQNKELKASKDEIERQKDELVNKEISTWQKLINIITHEIMNSAIPITNLAGITGQMLEDESGAILKPEKIGRETTEDIHHCLKVIESRTHALVDFVKATRSLTHLPKPNIRKVIIQDLFDRITILYQTKFKELGIHFEKYIDPPDLFITADLELVEQVMINLIQNAIEAMHGISDPRLSLIATKNESNHVRIDITDNGLGISEEVKEQIFLPYYSTKPNNSGIGLSLSQQIMMLHHAHLEVSSVPGKGATFTMVF